MVYQTDAAGAAGDATEAFSFCRICEACCGLAITVREGRITSVKGDPDHPTSRGYLCPKGASMADVVYDPERVLTPLRRVGGPGEFEPVAWGEALDDIAARARALVERHGPRSVAMYSGNPLGFSLGHSTWAKRFMDVLGSPNLFSASPQDTHSRSLASYFLYGSATLYPIPDIFHVSYLLVVGANPLVSHGSLLSVGRIREELQAIVERGGRVVVVDPAATKTAKAFEHVPVAPGSDVWLLGALLNVIVDDGLHDAGAIKRQADDFEALRAAIVPLTVERAAVRTGLDEATIRTIAHDFATAPAAAAYGRIGACRGRFPTLTNYLLDALSVVTGNFDRRGGLIFGKGLLDIGTVHARVKRASYASARTRIGDLPDVTGRLPYVLPQEITTPGDGQVRGLFCSAGNPVASAPDGAALEEAVQQLELFVSVDHYITETNRYAHYVLPGTTFLERSDALLYFGGTMPRPWAQVTGPVIPPLGDARDDWQIYDELIARLGGTPPAASPDELADELVRASPRGEREGWTMARLAEHPHGVLLDDEVDVGDAGERLLVTLGGRSDKVQLGAPTVLAEVGRLLDEPPPDPSFPLLLIGRRELRSINSWMHNVRPVRPARPAATLHIHPHDARRYGVDDGADVALTTTRGTVLVRAEITVDIRPGTVSYPHGWGHGGGWTTANAHGGANINRFLPNDVATKEPLSGMSFMDGVPVRVTPSAQAERHALGEGER